MMSMGAIYDRYIQEKSEFEGRRSSTNAFYLTINTGAASALGLALTQGLGLWVLIALPALVLVCAVWHRTLGTYRRIAAAKYQVIDELESSLGCRPHAREQELMRKCVSLSKLEQVVPLAFGGTYLLIAGGALIATLI